MSRRVIRGGMTHTNESPVFPGRFIVIGRKNWLFANTVIGARASAMLYSLIETAKANGLTPFDYLQHLLEELPKQPPEIELLLPWNVVLPQQVKR